MLHFLELLILNILTLYNYYLTIYYTMPRNYAKEYKNYQGLPKSIKERASRNKARKIMVDKHGEKACKNKHIDHRS